MDPNANEEPLLLPRQTLLGDILTIPLDTVVEGRLEEVDCNSSICDTAWDNEQALALQLRLLHLGGNFQVA